VSEKLDARDKGGSGGFPVGNVDAPLNGKQLALVQACR